MTKVYKIAIVAFLVIAVLAISYSYISPQDIDEQSPSLGSSPIYTDVEAIDRAVGLLEEGVSRHGEIARMTTVGDVFGEETASSPSSTVMGGYGLSSPVWIVAILSDNISSTSVETLGTFEMSSVIDSIGIIFFFEAGSGDLIAQTFMADSDEYDSIYNMPTTVFAIDTTTPMPPIPTVDASLYLGGQPGSNP